MVVRAADAAARSLASDGLPGPAMDYWENSVQVTLGTAAPLLAGLRAAAALAADIGGPAAAARPPLDGRGGPAGQGHHGRFGRTGYQRRRWPARASTRPSRSSGRRSRSRALRCSGGQVSTAGSHRCQRRPGSRRGLVRHPDVAWTPETAFFALFDAATGQHRQAAALLDWLAAHRTETRFAGRAGQFRRPAGLAPLRSPDRRGGPAGTARAGRARPGRPGHQLRSGE